METTSELRYAVKEELVNMVLEDCSILEDFHSLDINTTFDRAEAKLKGDEEYQRVLTKNKLGEFVSMDLDEAIKIWETLDSTNDNDMADDHFTMWQPLEYSLTIGQLADQL